MLPRITYVNGSRISTSTRSHQHQLIVLENFQVNPFRFPILTRARKENLCGFLALEHLFIFVVQD
jgi:hypothetical protein